MKIEISELSSEGGLVLSFGNEMETDLIFAAGAMVKEDPLYEKQLKLMAYIKNAVEYYEEHCDNPKLTVVAS